MLVPLQPAPVVEEPPARSGSCASGALYASTATSGFKCSKARGGHLERWHANWGSVGALSNAGIEAMASLNVNRGVIQGVRSRRTPTT